MMPERSDATKNDVRRSGHMASLLRRLPTQPHSAVLRVVSTIAMVGLSAGVMVLVRHASGVLGWFVLLPAIYLASILFDRGAGLMSVALSAVALYVVDTPTGQWLLPANLLFPFLLFLLIAVGIAVVSEQVRAALTRVAAAERSTSVLLAELRHRTRNDFAMVISMLSMQARLKSSAEARDALEKAVNRIEAIASMHEHVEPLDMRGHVEMGSYLEQLCGHLGDLLRDIRPIAVRVEAAEVYLPAEQAAPIGLIVNELVTNALKYAFPDGRAGAITVRLKAEGGLMLSVADNGVGCSDIQREGLGSRLTRLLAQQLNASISWEPREVGCEVRLVFSV